MSQSVEPTVRFLADATAGSPSMLKYTLNFWVMAVPCMIVFNFTTFAAFFLLFICGMAFLIVAEFVRYVCRPHPVEEIVRHVYDPPPASSLTAHQPTPDPSTNEK